MTIAILGRTASRWLSGVAGRTGHECVFLDLEAPLRDGEVVIDDGRVLWQGFELTAADVVLCERAAYAWPQPGSGRGGLTPHAEREARALRLSALLTAARSVPVLDDPRTAHLWVAPLLALDELARAGSAVHPWSLVAERPERDADGRVWMDPTGADLVHEPRTPVAGEAAWAPEPFEGGLLAVLVIDARVAGARRYASLAARAADEHDALLAPAQVPSAAAQAAVRAQQSLGLSWLEVDLRARGGTPEHALVRVVPGAELDRWDQDLQGEVVAALAALLESRIGVQR